MRPKWALILIISLIVSNVQIVCGEPVLSSPPLFADDFETYKIGDMGENVQGVWRKIAGRNSEGSSISIVPEQNGNALRITANTNSSPLIDTVNIDFYRKKAYIQMQLKYQGSSYARLLIMNEYDKQYTEMLRFGSKKIIFPNGELVDILVYKKWHDIQLILDSTDTEQVKVTIAVNGREVVVEKVMPNLSSVPMAGLRFESTNGCSLFIDNFSVSEEYKENDNGFKIDLNDYKGGEMVTPPKEHPRLFLRKQDIEGIRENLTHPEMKQVWDSVDSTSKVEHTGELNQATSGNYSAAVREVIEANALKYVVQGDTQSGEKAVSMMKNFLETVTFPNVSDVTRIVGQVILTGGIVYDWCYDLIPESEKGAWVEDIERIASQMAIGYPPRNLSSVVGHSSEAQLLRDQLAAGVAIYDEAPDMYNHVAKRIFDDYIQARNFWNSSNAYHQGESYGTYRFQWDMFAAWIFERMGYSHVFAPQQGQVPYRWLYERRPDGQLLRDGDGSLASKYLHGDYWTFTTTMLLASNYYKDPYLKEEFLRQYSINPWDTENIWVVLFNDPKVKPISHETLPLSRYFGTPLGAVISRTGWDLGVNSNDVIVEMKVGEFMFNNHQHLDSGSFQIYYKGALAIDSGLYQGRKGGYGSAHDINYHKRTIAHNAMLVYDPNEEFYYNSTRIENDGGQRWPLNAREPYSISEVVNKGYNMAQVLAKDIDNPSYSYLKGDITSAYTDKINSYKRSFAFLNLEDERVPAILVVHDYVDASDAQFDKKWLLHCIEQPSVKGETIDIVRTEGAYDGKLVNTLLVPDSVNAKIEIVGGEKGQFSVNQTNYEQTPHSDIYSDEMGSYRVEISPKEKSETDTFLNVMQIMDGDALPLRTQKIETSEFIGAQISDRVVLFSKDGNIVEDDFSFSVKGPNKFLITDIKPGVWEVNGKNVDVYNEANTLYFEDSQDTYSVKRVGDHNSKQTTNEASKQKTPDIKLRLGGQYLYSYLPPQVLNGLTFVPLHTIEQFFGVTTEAIAKGVTLTKDGNIVAETSEALTINDTTYIPIRPVAEQLGLIVEWDEFSQTVVMLPLNSTDIIGEENVWWSSQEEGNPGTNAIDGNLETRWSAEGKGEWIMFDLGSIKTFDSISIAWFNGSTRNSMFSIYLSEDNQNWGKVYKGKSSGLTDEPEKFTFNESTARYIKIVGHGNSANSWNSITEVKLP